VGPRAGLNAVAKRKIPSPCGESNSDRPVRSLVTILTELSRFLMGYGSEKKIPWPCSNSKTRPSGPKFMMSVVNALSGY
jgi:hypothetical protein